MFSFPNNSSVRLYSLSQYSLSSDGHLSPALSCQYLSVLIHCLWCYLNLLTFAYVIASLAEPILERDKERGRRRSLALRQGRTTQSQPKSGRPIRGSPNFGCLPRCSSSAYRRGYAFVVTPCIQPKLGLPKMQLHMQRSIRAV